MNEILPNKCRVSRTFPREAFYHHLSLRTLKTLLFFPKVINMGDTESLPTKHRELIAASIFMMFFSTAFTIWRIVVRFKASRRMDPSDWLMVLGAVRIRLIIHTGFR
jgi:hypothetical protein